MRAHGRFISSIALGAMIIPAATQAQARARAESKARTEAALSEASESERGYLGISTGSSGMRDTLGLLITNVSTGSAAEKAGLEEGNRIASINGVNLKVSRDDAGEYDMAGIASRRLQREMSKTKPGDDVELRVWQNGAYKTLKVKVGELPERTMMRTAMFSRIDRDSLRAARENRAVIGLSVGSTGSRRDTLGLLVSRVVTDGPAEKAGIIEGDRIAAINGVDLRVSREDAGDHSVASAKLNRFLREAARIKAGEGAELRVVSGGQSKTIRVTAVRTRDLPNEGGWSYYVGDGGSGFSFSTPRAIVAPRVPVPPGAALRYNVAPKVRVMTPGRVRVDASADDFDDDVDMDLDMDMDMNMDMDFDIDVDGIVDEALQRVAPALEKIGPTIDRAVKGAFERKTVKI